MDEQHQPAHGWTPPPPVEDDLTQELLAVPPTNLRRYVTVRFSMRLALLALAIALVIFGFVLWWLIDQQSKVSALAEANHQAQIDGRAQREAENANIQAQVKELACGVVTFFKANEPQSPFIQFLDDKYGCSTGIPIPSPSPSAVPTSSGVSGTAPGTSGTGSTTHVTATVTATRTATATTTARTTTRSTTTMTIVPPIPTITVRIPGPTTTVTRCVSLGVIVACVP